MSVKKITYFDVEIFLKEHGGGYEEILKSVDHDIIKGRDRSKNKVPLYSTKYRLKDKNSLYLKMKRKPKYTKITDATDIGGMRILCLFEQDLPETFMFLLKEVLSVKHRKILECSLFNFDATDIDFYSDKQIWEKFQPDFFKNFNKNFKIEKKTSGYRSIHFLLESSFEGEKTIEIQLRSLLQDVWGEIEHNMLYKQASNHSMSNMFKWLQNDLANVDSMLSQFKEHEKKSLEGEILFNENFGPFSFMGYEKIIFPKGLQNSASKLSRASDSYVKTCKSRKGPVVKNEKKNEILTAFKTVKECLPKYDLRKDTALKYWVLMEEAYVSFCLGNRKEALSIYNEICHNELYSDRYVPRFRAGEIYYLEEKHTEAFKKFDEAELILEGQNSHRENNDPVSINRTFNHYLIQTKLALNFWRMGGEYLPLSLSHITQAANLARALQNNPSALDDDKKSMIEGVLDNNVCWFNLETFHREWSGDSISVDLKSSDEKTSKRAKLVQSRMRVVKKNFKLLPDQLNEECPQSNFLDTASWFFYTQYLIEMAEHKANLKAASKRQKSTRQVDHEKRGLKYLTMALAYVRKLISSDRGAIRLNSVRLQNEHLKQITLVAKQHGLLPKSSNLDVF